MSDPVTPPARGHSLLLIISLCLNIALVPVIAAVVVRAMHRDTAIGTGGVLAPRTLMSAIPDERGHIQKVIDAHTAKIRTLRQQAVRARKAAFDVLSAPGYTPEKMTAALDAVRTADGALEAESIAMMGESLAVLNRAERQAMIEKVRKRNRSWLYRMVRPRSGAAR